MVNSNTKLGIGQGVLEQLFFRGANTLHDFNVNNIYRSLHSRCFPQRDFVDYDAVLPELHAAPELCYHWRDSVT